jgi:hypothetical protein
MFEMVIGGLDTILERFEKRTSLETSLFRSYVEARSDEEMRHALDELGHSFREISEEVRAELEEQARIQALLQSSGRTVATESGGII